MSSRYLSNQVNQYFDNVLKNQPIYIYTEMLLNFAYLAEGRIYWSYNDAIICVFVFEESF